MSESIAEWEARRKQLLQPPNIINAASLLRLAEDEPRFLVPQRIPAGALTFVVAAPASAKSWLVFDLALAVCQQDRRWLDQEPEHGEVLVLSYDNPTPETARRFKRLGLKASDPISFHSVDQGAWKQPKAAETLKDLCIELQPKLVIVDSFRQAVDGNENSSEEMGIVMGGFKAMASVDSKPAIVVVHHSSKGITLEGAGTRGSGEIDGSADATIAIDKGEVRWTKTRCWPMPESFRLKYQLVDEDKSTRLKLVAKKEK